MFLQQIKKLLALLRTEATIRLAIIYRGRTPDRHITQAVQAALNLRGILLPQQVEVLVHDKQERTPVRITRYLRPTQAAEVIRRRAPLHRHHREVTLQAQLLREVIRLVAHLQLLHREAIHQAQALRRRLRGACRRAAHRHHRLQGV
jgi:hypothetical protein